MFTILDYSSVLEYSSIRRYTDIVYYYYKLMYGCGALLWSQTECNDLEVKLNKMIMWLWDVLNVKNELIRGETGWSTFEENAMASRFLRIVFSENRMADLDRARIL